MDFSDNEHRRGIINKVRECDNSEEVYELIKEYYPDWVVSSLKGYSSDYPHLSANWLHICEKLQVNPQNIILVSQVIFEKNFSILQFLCDFICGKGYVVRRVGELIPCKECSLAIPCKEIWERLKYLKLPCPEKWSDTCAGCFS